MKKTACPDLDAHRSRLEPLAVRIGPLGRQSLPLGYKDVQGSFDELWRSGGIGRGIGDCSAAWSGVSRTLARARRSLASSFGPERCAALAPTCPKLVEGRSANFAQTISEVRMAPADPFLGCPHRVTRIGKKPSSVV